MKMLESVDCEYDFETVTDCYIDPSGIFNSLFNNVPSISKNNTFFILSPQ